MYTLLSVVAGGGVSVKGTLDDGTLLVDDWAEVGQVRKDGDLDGSRSWKRKALQLEGDQAGESAVWSAAMKVRTASAGMLALQLPLHR